ncbi:MAG: helix-turn-helix domain-containing protein [Ramlibacter sp.]|nr:helix-turn-helix domain-containing protein [Ramlibacter sp.]
MPRKAQTASLAEAHAAPGGTAAVDRALTLLGAFRAGDAALTLAELAERTRLYKSTALRLLASLAHAGLVQRLEAGTDRGSWALGPEVARLHSIHAAAFSLDQVVMPVLQALMKATGESAAYHVLRGEGDEQVRLCLYRVDSPQPIRDFIKAGDVLSASRGTGARVLQAFGKPRSGLGARDRRLLAGIRERGFFTASGDRLAGVTGISAPVFDADARIAAAVTLTMPTHRYDERHVQPVLAAARQLSGKV